MTGVWWGANPPLRSSIETECLSNYAICPIETPFMTTPLDLSTTNSYPVNAIVGVAVFDWNGLPKEYLMTDENRDLSWVQTVFQILGLRSLLISSLFLEGFQHATVSDDRFHAVIVKHQGYYVALLISRAKMPEITEKFLVWTQRFNYEELSKNPRYHIT